MGKNRDINPSIENSIGFDANKVLGVSIAIVLLNLLLKGRFLTGNDIAIDEPFSIFHAQQSLSDLQQIFVNENNPPLHFWVLHFWIKFFGLSPAAVRFPFLLFSGLTSGVIFFVGSRHFGRIAAAGAAMLFTFSTEQAFYAHEARTYALFIFLTALSIGSFLHASSKVNDRGTWIWLTLWNILLLYTHFLGIVLIAVQGLTLLLLFPEKKKSLIFFVLSCFVAALVWLPQMILFLGRVNAVSENGTWVERPAWSALYQTLAQFLNSGWGLLAAVASILVSLGIAFFQQKLRAFFQNRPFLILLALFGITYVGLFAISFIFTPVFFPRYLIFLSIPLYWLVGWGIQYGFSGNMKWAAFMPILLIIALQCNVNPTNHREVSNMVNFVQTNRTADMPVIICPYTFDLTWMYHYDLDIFRNYQNAHLALFQRNCHPVSSWEAFDQGFLNNATGAVYVDAGAELLFPENGIKEGLKAQFQQVEHYHFEEIFEVWVFRNKQDIALPLITPTDSTEIQ